MRRAIIWALRSRSLHDAVRDRDEASRLTPPCQYSTRASVATSMSRLFLAANREGIGNRLSGGDAPVAVHGCSSSQYSRYASQNSQRCTRNVGGEAAAWLRALQTTR
jgi:hypothetical protein